MDNNKNPRCAIKYLHLFKKRTSKAECHGESKIELRCVNNKKEWLDLKKAPKCILVSRKTQKALIYKNKS